MWDRATFSSLKNPVIYSDVGAKNLQLIPAELRSTPELIKVNKPIRLAWVSGSDIINELEILIR